MWEIVLAIGAILLGAGIVFNHYWGNRYWIALIVAGIIVLVIGLILLGMAAFLILPAL